LETGTGMLRVETREGDGPNLRRGQVSVQLEGFGGGPDIDVRPPALAFPRTGVGLVVEKNVTIYNVGTDPQNQRPLVVTDFFIDGASSPNGGEFDVQGGRSDVIEARFPSGAHCCVSGRKLPLIEQRLDVEHRPADDNRYGAAGGDGLHIGDGRLLIARLPAQLDTRHGGPTTIWHVYPPSISQAS
jgi:hypothetical protein